MPIYSINGITLPAGGETYQDAGLVTPLSVTAPTVGFYSEDPKIGSPTNHVWYKFTAPTDGMLIADSLLSYDSDGPTSVQVDVFKSTAGLDATTDDQLLTYDGGFGFAVFPVVAGTSYYLALWDWAAPGATNLILRLSDYGAVSEWVQPADQTWVAVPDEAMHDPVLPTAPAFLDGVGGTAGYGGRYVISRSFLGPHPGILPEAPNSTGCAWKHVAAGCDYGQWWSPDPENPDVDIKAAWNGGPGTCSTVFPERTGNNTFDLGATYSTGAESDGHANTITQAYGLTQRFWVSHILPDLGPTGGLPAPIPPPGGTVEYEADEGELLGIDASPDQTVTGESATINGEPAPLIITTQWLGKAVPIDENPGNTWGPKTNYIFDGDDFATDRFILGGLSGNDGFAAAQDFQLADLPPDATVPADWEPIDSALIDAALGYEAAWQEQWDAGIDLSLISTYGGGLRFVGLFPEVLDPFANLFGNFAEADLNVDQRRHGQFVAIRVHVRPPRYRYRNGPVIPEVDGHQPIRLWPRDDELGINSSPRMYPMSKSNARGYSAPP